MTELLHAAVSAPNLAPTALLVFVLLYWLTILAGILDLKTVDLDIDHDVDLGHHAEAHPPEMGVSWLNHALTFFNLGRIPLMVFLSFVALPLWAGSILLNYYLHNESGLLGLALLLPLLLGSLLLAKVLTLPFVHLYAAMEKNHDGGVRPLGKVCTVLLPATAYRLGQARVQTQAGAPLMLNVLAASPTAELRKGDTALVIDYDEQRRCYLIEPYEVF
ncbi:hypothetical protein HMJ29_19850 [Hymenobacter taeanensis]|uniref:DUF1449 family protein n=1 Tax=Hymenobacter taeanensis TaxID=2735321 RepID=A0A6M6BM31_9BACT|nr:MULTISPECIES: hypothetical protein [Hymenobacter]QJX49037.1 hypothetical protein HMJ29_19850 [Hymenobacter taeanensis]UOQ81445.1 hypothetical protein MUN83_01180 [Hymenobacter sp. 5414T-23]